MKWLRNWRLIIYRNQDMRFKRNRFCNQSHVLQKMTTWFDEQDFFTYIETSSAIGVIAFIPAYYVLHWWRVLIELKYMSRLLHLYRDVICFRRNWLLVYTSFLCLALMKTDWIRAHVKNTVLISRRNLLLWSWSKLIKVHVKIIVLISRCHLPL